jgi:CubicO group peptidase (beta-lactamase class C family)
MKLNFVILSLVISPFIGLSQNLYFPPNTGNTWDTLSPESLNWCPSEIDNLYSFLDTNNTKAFILLKDGKIVLEKYFGTHTQSSTWYWASAGKTITSFLIGIAQQENYLSISDTTSTYLGPGWTDCTPIQEEKITIRNQLTMTSGLDDGVPDHYCTLDTCLIYLAEPDTRWAYHNGPYTLLDSVIENATGMTMNGFTTQKLKSPIGMTGLFIPVDYNNVFYSTARSMARFGLLMLNNGNWNGNQIMTDLNYFNQMITPSQSMNNAYGYLWWLNGSSSYMVPGSQFVFNGQLNSNAPTDMYAAIGKNGQFINVVPSENLVWIRMGDAPDNSDVPFLMNNEIWSYLNQLNCGSTGLSDSEMSELITISPNPFSENFLVSSEKEIIRYELYNTQGQLLILKSESNYTINLPTSSYKNGVYFLKVILNDGNSVLKKILKN